MYVMKVDHIIRGYHSKNVYSNFVQTTRGAFVQNLYPFSDYRSFGPKPKKIYSSQGPIVHKQITVSYFFLNKSGKALECQKFFAVVLGITEHRTNTVAALSG